MRKDHRSQAGDETENESAEAEERRYRVAFPEREEVQISEDRRGRADLRV
ncbi:MAG: hypothetical protein P8020_16350 [Acidobacteriota bacterium]